MGPVAEFQGIRRQQKDQRGHLNRAMEETAQTQARALDTIGHEASNYAPQQRLQQLGTQEQAAYDQAQHDLASSSPAQPMGGGRMSADFMDAQADRTAAEGDRMSAIARELSKVRAPGMMTTAEGIRRGNMTGELGSMWSTARNMSNAHQLDAEAVEMPWWGQVGRLANAAGRGAMRAGAGGMG